ncbi:hypothetical protein GCM10023190_22050 [Enteractinococcus fodinae]
MGVAAVGAFGNNKGHDFIAHRQVGIGGFVNGLNHAGGIHARHMRSLAALGASTRATRGVRGAHGSGLDPNENLTGADFRIRELHHFKNVWAAWSIKCYSFHAGEIISWS